MRIKKIEFRPITFARMEPFRIATGTSNRVENVFVRLITDSGTIGWGACAPNSVTKETTVSIIDALRYLSKHLQRFYFNTADDVATLMDKSVKGNPAAKAGVDIAVHDVISQDAGIPLYRYLQREQGHRNLKFDSGNIKESIETDITIGIMSPEDTLRHADMYIKDGFKILNIKVGLDMNTDISRIREIRERFGNRIRLRVDGNQGYSVRKAIEFAEHIETLGIEFIEQPVKASNLVGLKKVTKKSTIPIVADEAIYDSKDAIKIIDGEYADMLNVKLMKCAGLTDALRIADYADNKKIALKVGCMGESRLANTAGFHFALSRDSVKYADLDSWVGIVSDCASEGFKFSRGILRPYIRRAGLGARVVIKMNAS